LLIQEAHSGHRGTKIGRQRIRELHLQSPGAHHSMGNLCYVECVERTSEREWVQRSVKLDEEIVAPRIAVNIAKRGSKQSICACAGESPPSTPAFANRLERRGILLEMWERGANFREPHFGALG
jgi:hypothetical protein